MIVIDSIKSSIEAVQKRFDEYKLDKTFLLHSGDGGVTLRVATSNGRSIYVEGNLKADILALLAVGVQKEGKELEAVKIQLGSVAVLTTKLGGDDA